MSILEEVINFIREFHQGKYSGDEDISRMKDITLCDLVKEIERRQ